MNYTSYQAEDFAANESFTAYYLKTDEEAIRFWEKWISEHPEKLDAVYNAKHLLATLHLRLADEELHSAFVKFDEFIEAEKAAEIFYQEQKVSFFTVKRIFAICALAIFFSTIGIYLMKPKTERAISYTLYHTSFGKTAQLTLADGSIVTLNANSTLKYPKYFTSNKREVTLEGEGFFEITKDKKRPFSVHAKGTTTTVLGTKFNINAYPNDKTVKIALVEGKVIAEAINGKNKLVLKPSEAALWSENTNQLTTTAFNSEETIGWKSGVLAFDNASFTEIAAKFKNVYGIELINHSKLVKWSFSGRYNKTDYQTVIKSICFSKKLNYKLKNNMIILTP